MLGADGVIFTEPRQVPARVLSWSNDICASDGAALSVALCISDCAKATVAKNMRAMGDTKRRDFIFILLKESLLFPDRGPLGGIQVRGTKSVSHLKGRPYLLL